MLARSDFENAVKEALRHYTQADLLAENALLRTRLLTSSKPGAATPQGLRILLAETAKALFAGERDQRLYREFFDRCGGSRRLLGNRFHSQRFQLLLPQPLG